MGVDPRSAVALSTSDGETHDVWVPADGVERPHTSLWKPQLQTALIGNAGKPEGLFAIRSDPGESVEIEAVIRVGIGKGQQLRPAAGRGAGVLRLARPLPATALRACGLP